MVVAAEESTTFWKTVQFSSGSSELRFIAPNWFEMSLMKACPMLSWFSFRHPVSNELFCLEVAVQAEFLG